NVLTRALAAILVLYIYSEDKTATMKMPWIILIMLFPIVGVTIYLLVGLNKGTRKMRERYQAIDEVLLPLLPDSSDLIENLKQTHPKAASISHYLQIYAKYPLYLNTDVTRSEEHTSELQSRFDLVCCLLLENKIFNVH